MSRKRLVVLSGAGISAESGVKTFRDSNGLWENHRVEDVASPEGFAQNPRLVLDFYNQRRRQLLEVEPNAAHLLLAQLQHDFHVSIITQNVDDLHERAGSKNVLHLHGELLKARPVNADEPVVEWRKDLNVGDLTDNGIQLRPHIVWFGEMVPNMDAAVALAEQADIFLVIGTSLQVYPAAGLVHYVPEDCPVYVIDPHLEPISRKNAEHIQATATLGMTQFAEILRKKYLSQS